MKRINLRFLIVLLSMVSGFPVAGAEAGKGGAHSPYGHSVTKVGVLPVASAWGSPLAYTEQVIAFGGDNKKLKNAGFEEQFTNCLARLAQDLNEVRSGFEKLVRLNFYLRSDQDRVKAQAYLARHMPGANTPLTFVTGQLERPDARIAMDAIGLTTISKELIPRAFRVMDRIPQGRHGAIARLLIPGQRVFISGQAVRAESIADATRKTMIQLNETLKFLKLRWVDVVQVKSFMQPMSEVGTVADEISRFFQASNAPPQVFVEWTSSAPIEIELVVNGGPAKTEGPLVEYLTPPAMKASPVFTRVVRVNRGKLVYTSSLYGPTDRGKEQEIRSIFDELKLSMMVMGADLKHLVKATYYVANNDSSRLLNKLRPDYYDPKRPPAASKAAVRGTGLSNHSITIDMIGVAE